MDSQEKKEAVDHDYEPEEIDNDSDADPDVSYGKLVYPKSHTPSSKKSRVNNLFTLINIIALCATRERHFISFVVK